MIVPVMSPREKHPFISKGDDVTIRKSGAISGVWRVAAARYANDNPEDNRINLVLSRGSSSMMFKTPYDPQTMTVKNNTPPHILSRDMRVGKSVGDVRRKGGGRRP